jgi:hypothetical protein
MSLLFDILWYVFLWGVLPVVIGCCGVGLIGAGMYAAVTLLKTRETTFFKRKTLLQFALSCTVMIVGLAIVSGVGIYVVVMVSRGHP